MVTTLNEVGTHHKRHVHFHRGGTCPGSHKRLRTPLLEARSEIQPAKRLSPPVVRTRTKRRKRSAPEGQLELPLETPETLAEAEAAVDRYGYEGW